MGEAGHLFGMRIDRGEYCRTYIRLPRMRCAQLVVYLEFLTISKSSSEVRVIGQSRLIGK